MNLTRTSTLAIALLVFVGVVYAGTFKYPFFFDDSHFILGNIAIHTPANLFRIWTSATYNSNSPVQWGYRPLTTFFHSLAWIVGGGQTWPFHILKKTVHAFVCLFLFLVWKRIWEFPGFFPYPAPAVLFKWRAREWTLRFTPTVAAVALAFAFAVHPANNEVINYISASTTLLSGFFVIAGFYLYLRFRERPRIGYLLASLAVYALAVLAKEEGITLCALVLLAEIILPRSGRIGWRIIAYFAVALAMANLLRLHFIESSNVARGDVPRFAYFMTQWRAYLHYFVLLIWPWDLNADNLSFGFSSSLSDTKVLAALLGNSLLIVGAWVQRKRYPIFIFSLVWFYIAVSPASSIVPLAEPVNDRRMYIGYLGLVGLFPWILKAIEGICRKESGRLSPVSALLVAGGFVGLLVGTEVRNRVWSSTESLWVDTVEKNPGSARALNNLALVYMGQGDWKRSQDLLERCERSNPNYSVCKTNQGVIFAATGRDSEADLKFRDSIAVDPFPKDTKSFYASFLEQRKRFEESLVQYREVDALAGGTDLPAKLGWARSARALGHEDEARVVLDEARTHFGDRPEIIAILSAGAK